MTWKKSYFNAEKKVSLFVRKYAIQILKYAMGIIYFWFGLLKVMDISPAEELVVRTTHWIGVRDFDLILGLWEMAIGLCLFSRRYLRIGLYLLFLQFPGTFLPLFLVPEVCFTKFPYGLTLEGQYVFKNLVLIAAGLVLIGALHPPKKKP